MASGLRDFGVTVGARGVMLFVGIANQSCLAWVLGPAERGSYAVCLLFATLLSVIFTMGGTVVSTYLVASKKQNISEGVIHAFVYYGSGSALAMLAGFVTMQLPISFFTKASTTSFYLALVSILTGILALALPQLLTAVQDFIWFAVTLGLGSIVNFLCTLTFVWLLSWGVNGALTSVIASSSFTVVFTLVLLWKKHDLRWAKPSFRNLREMFNYGMRFYVGKITQTLSFQLESVVLSLFATREQIALFSVAALLAGQVMLIPDNLMDVLIPRVSSDRTGREALIAQLARLSSVSCAVLLLVLVVFARPITALLFSPAFLPMVPLVRILAIGLLAWCGCKVFIPYLIGTNHPGMVSGSVASGMVVNLGALLVLLPRIGLVGAAIAMTLGYLVNSCLVLVSFCRLTRMGLVRVWRFSRSDLDVVVDAIRRVTQKGRNSSGGLH